jgi:hypothetical protein
MRTVRTVLTIALCLGLVACASTNVADDDDDDTADAAPGTPDADPFRPDSRPPPTNAAVYAHSADELYKINPDDFAVTLVAAFGADCADDDITDIAIDDDGNMVGISVTTLYSIDSDTAACTFVATLDGSFVGLSYVPVAGQDDALIAAAFDGTVSRINPTTGSSTVAGSFGNGIEASGDIVAVKDFGIVATVEVPAGGNDRLARLDALTFEATIIGDTGFTKLFGLGFWKNEVYGFSANNEFVLIDVDTGAGSIIETGSVAWWGAGVTTLAPIIN